MAFAHVERGEGREGRKGKEKGKGCPVSGLLLSLFVLFLIQPRCGLNGIEGIGRGGEEGKKKKGKVHFR